MVAGVEFSCLRTADEKMEVSESAALSVSVSAKIF